MWKLLFHILTRQFIYHTILSFTLLMFTDNCLSLSRAVNYISFSHQLALLYNSTPPHLHCEHIMLLLSFQYDWLPAFNSGCCFACVHALFLIHFSLNCCRYQTYIHPFLPNITSYIICCNKHLYSIHKYLLLGMKRKYNQGALKCK